YRLDPGQWIGVVPGDVLVPADAEIRRSALVRALRVAIARLGRRDDVLERDVVARRQPRLEQQQRPQALGEQLAVALDADVPRARTDVDARERIAGVSHHLLLFLEPLVGGLPREEHQTVVVGIAELLGLVS